MEHLLLHGHDVVFHRSGSGPVIVLIHGVTQRATNWAPVVPALAEAATVVAPDLMGHGDSAKPRGDYSLGAHAAGVRDLLTALGHERVTVVGHSLGGGIALQFAYQFPERVERLVLVSSGGLGRDVTLLLRAATLPGAGYVLPVLGVPALRSTADAVLSLLARAGVRGSEAFAESWRGASSLANAEARRAFLHTLRAVVDVGGQRVDATDRLYLTSHIPAMLVWGTHDRIIPVAHAERAAELMPGSRLELLEGAGHFPHVEQPQRFSQVLLDFIASTAPASPTASLSEAIRRSRAVPAVR